LSPSGPMFVVQTAEWDSTGRLSICVLNTVSFGVAWQLPITFWGVIVAGATYVADVALFEISVPELPLAIDQFTGRLVVTVTAPFSEANVAEGVTTRPPLVIADVPVPVAVTRRGDPGWFPLTAMAVVSAATELGLKLTDNVQVAPDAKMLPQVFDTRKSLELPPLTVIPDSDKNVVPILLSVRLLAALWCRLSGSRSLELMEQSW